MKRVLWISGVITGLLLALLLSGWAGAEDKVNKALRQGNKEYAAAKYAEALQAYETGLAAKPEHKTLNFNAAQAAYLLGEYEKAARYYEKAPDCAAKYLNAGNSFLRLGDAAQDGKQKAQYYTQALQIYKEGIIKFPPDVPLKYNYEFVQKKMDELFAEREEEQGSGARRDGESAGNSGRNDGQSYAEESQGQEGEEAENTRGEQDKNSERNGNSGELQDAGENGDEQQEAYPRDGEAANPDRENIARILAMLESQEEESLKNNRGVVRGKDDGNGW